MAVELAPQGTALEADRPEASRLPLAVALEAAMPWLAGAMAFGVYVATLAPTISILDSPELSAAAITLGVPHPTGYPLFVLLGHLWSVAFGALAGGDPAWGLNLLTAFCAAIAVAGIAAAGRRLSGRASGGWLAAGAFAYAPAFWAQANVVEVYALHMAFTAAILWTALRFDAAASRSRDTGGRDAGGRDSLRVLALLCGFSMTHHLMTVLVLPVLAVLLLHHWRRWWSVREAALLGVLGLAPLGLYGLLPWIAAGDPLVNWGNPERASALWFHVTGGQYHHNVGGLDASLGEVLASVPRRLVREMGVALLPLAALGAWRLRGQRGLALALGFAVALAFGVSYGVVDSEPFYLNALVIVALWVGVGASALQDFLGERNALAGRVFEAAVWLAPVVVLANGFAKADRHDEYDPHDHAVAALAALPENAVVLTSGPAGYPPVYAQLVERLRPDVAVVDLYLNVRGSYGPELDRLRQSRLPDGVTRELAVTETVARLDDGSRSLWLMPGVPEEPWDRLGLTRLQAGLLHPLVRGALDLRVPAPLHPGVARFERGASRLGLLDAALGSPRVEAGTGLGLALTWRLPETPVADAAPGVTLVLADEAGDAPTRRDGLPLLEQRHPLGLGAPLDAYAPGEVIREELHLLVPRAVEPGRWWIWVAVSQGGEGYELPGGQLFARVAPLEVTPRKTPLWTLPAADR